MSFNLNEWTFSHSSTNEVPLEEPVAFEDFQFSLGLDPNFSMPIPLDMPPPLPMTNYSNNWLMDENIPTTATVGPPHSVLNENDQKAFSQFLDQFFVDPSMQTTTTSIPTMYLDQEDEYYRQSSILQSLDEQKKVVYLSHNESPSSNSHSSGEQIGGGSIRRNNNNKPHKELLTEEEKRHNHIASEQKRRGMIRNGFKDLTDIVPTLKNINNSKSTVLFKAVDYIKYLEKRNRNLREKIKNLEVRAEVEGKINIIHNHNQQQPQQPQQQQTNTTNTALLQHKTQQKQLIELQKKLQLHQKLLAQQQQTNVSA